MTEESFNKLQEVMINANELSQSAPFEKVINNSFATNLNK